MPTRRRSPKPQSRHKTSGHHPNYPRRGTPAGDKQIGTCDGEQCDRLLLRGDMFFITLAEQLYCLDCWEKVPGVDLGKSVPAELHEIPASKRAPEPPADHFVWDGAFPE